MACTAAEIPPSLTRTTFWDGINAMLTIDQQLMAIRSSSSTKRFIESNMIAMPLLPVFDPTLNMPDALTIALLNSIPSFPPKGRASNTRVWNAAVCNSTTSGNSTIALKTISVRPAC
eukprot:458371_1